MNAIKVDTTIDETLARAVPALRPLLGRRVELIALEADAATPQRRKLNIDEFLAARIKRPPGSNPISIDDMERGTADFADYMILGSSRYANAIPVLTFDANFAAEPDVRLVPPR